MSTIQNKTINPTRMERSIQIGRLKTAKRGHKLLKDKSDEMFRNLLVLQKERDAIAETVERDAAEIMRNFMTARGFMSCVEIDNAIAAVKLAYEFNAATRNIMGLVVPAPKIDLKESDTEFSYFMTHKSFDRAAAALPQIMKKLIHLASLEKICTMLEREIKMLRRRINSLEHNVIPSIKEIVRYITLKLAENERGNLVRIMKVKEMMTDHE